MVDRRGSDRVARAIQLRVLQENKSREELLRESGAATQFRMGLPVDWKNNDKQSGQSMASIIAADGSEIASYAKPPSRVCGECKKYNIASGRKAIMEQRFGERLVRDQAWQLHHLGVPMDHLGMCDESAGTMVTCSNSNADKCEAFRRK